MGRVTVFSLATCPHCQRAKAALTARKIPYTDVSLTDYPEKRADVLQLTDRLTVPQIFFNDVHVGGASDLDALIASHDGDGGGGGGGGDGDGGGLRKGTVNEKTNNHHRRTFDDVVREVLRAPDPTDARLARPDHAPTPAPTPSARTHPVVVTVGARGLTYVDAVREVTAALAASDAIRDRAHNLTVYKRCFVGSLAVDALSRHFNLDTTDRGAAVAVGQALVDAGVMHHVTKAHGFEDAYLFYRLQPDAEPGVLNAFRGEWNDRLDDPLVTVKHLQKTFGELQAKHADAESGLVDYASLAADPAYALDFKEAVCEFRAVDLSAMQRESRLAFLINLYNLMILHAFGHVGAARTNGGRYTFFDLVKTNIGGHLYSFNDIEQGLIRGNKPAPYHLYPVFNRGDPRCAYVVPSSSSSSSSSSSPSSDEAGADAGAGTNSLLSREDK